MTGTNGLNRAVLYARVSSKDQEREGFSIPAQRKLLQSTRATQPDDRPGVRRRRDRQAGGARRIRRDARVPARRHPSCRTILVEKTDRLYRNIRDWITVDDLDLTVHFVKENAVVSKDVALVRQVHARHQGADGEELRGQPERGGQEGTAREGRAGPLADRARPSATSTTAPRIASTSTQSAGR